MFIGTFHQYMTVVPTLSEDDTVRLPFGTRDGAGLAPSQFVL